MNKNKASLGLLASYQAFENELNESEELRCGISENGRLWETIILYNQTEEWLYRTFPNLSITSLAYPYAILRATKEQLDFVLDNPYIVYAEKPNLLFFEEEDRSSKYSSCIFPENTSTLKGYGTLLGIIDSGIDIFHPDFIDPFGKSKILALYDEQGPRTYSNDDINEVLSLGRAQGAGLIPLDLSGHGTAVAGIAGGNHGVAPESELVVVRLAPGSTPGAPNTAGLMEGIEFCLRQSRERNLPIAINISYGNTYGSHSGSTLLENYLDYCSRNNRCIFVIGSGNEGTAAGQWVGMAPSLQEFSIGSYELTVSLQIYFLSWQNFAFRLTTPQGKNIPIPTDAGAYRFQIDRRSYVYILVKEATPYTPFEEIYLNFFPGEGESYLTSGIYRLDSLPPSKGQYGIWMAPSNIRSPQTKFLSPSIETSLTIPGSADSAITVGSYDSGTGILSPFSGRGYTFSDQKVKPDLVAPGVNILSASPGGGYGVRTGTSMAAPFVSGVCCLYMQQGITDGKDSFLYGEKLKARIIADAGLLPGQSNIPNPSVGWGRLCFRP